MITALVALHCVGVGGTLVYMLLSNGFTRIMGSDRGVFSPGEVLLCSAGWEIYWTGALLSAAKEKRQKANAGR